MHKIPVGVLGASGYAGRELCALVVRHPALELRFAAANERRGERAVVGGREVAFVDAADAPLAAAELVFSALPHGVSAEWVERAAGAGARVVDLSADLRPGLSGTRDSGLGTGGPAGTTLHADGPVPSPESPVPYGLTELM